jgi:hypothetical protein
MVHINIPFWFENDCILFNALSERSERSLEINRNLHLLNRKKAKASMHIDWSMRRAIRPVWLITGAI